MKKSLLSLLAILFLHSANAQVPFPMDGAIWVNTQYSYTFNPPNPIPDSELIDTEEYCVYGEDTTMLGNVYTKVFYCGANYKGALREVNSVVYFVPAGESAEYLLYDFSATQGQNLVDVYIGNHFDESFILQDFTVQQTGTEVIGGVTRRVVWADSYRWIEGIGCETGLFMEPWANVSMYGNFLECMSVNSQRLFPTEENGACPLMVAIAPQSETIEAELHPNPTSDAIFIQLNSVNDFTIEVLDLQGRLLESRFIANSNKVEVQLGAESGVYLVRVMTDNLGSKVFRVLKN